MIQSRKDRRGKAARKAHIDGEHHKRKYKCKYNWRCKWNGVTKYIHQHSVKIKNGIVDHFYHAPNTFRGNWSRKIFVREIWIWERQKESMTLPKQYFGEKMFFLDAHRLCNLSLSLLLLYLRPPERVDGVGSPVSVSRLYPTLYFLCEAIFIISISFSLSNIFLSVCQMYVLLLVINSFSFRLSNIFILVYQLYFYQFVKCM